MSNKKILLIVVLVILAGILGVFLTGSYGDVSPTATTTPTGSDDSPVSGVDVKPVFPGQTLPLSNAPKDVAWAVFQKYLGYNKSRDIEGVRSAVYKIAAICEDPKTRIDCEARMSLAYQYGSVMQKEDFVNVWADGKQIVLSTDFETGQVGDAMSRVRSIIFFVRDESNNLKMLSFSPFKGASTNKGAASQEEVDQRLIIYTEDKDNDGMADYQEECIGIIDGAACAKTSPKIRDTNGDGWWDGVEALMN